MPSKKKKNSKTPVKLSYSDQSASSHALSSSLRHSEPEISEEDLSKSILEEASIKYPSLISTSAFVGRIADVETKPGHAATIWLSETAMVASSISHGSIVSVSLAASRHLSSFLLDSLTDEYARHDGIDVWDKKASAAGNYFALAMACHSSKILKNDVRLSWSLSSTMGNPSLGKVTFVSPIQTQSVAGLLNGIDKMHNSTNTSIPCLSLCNCKDLYLELVPSMNRLIINGDMSSPINSTSETHHDQFENGEASSPKTPLFYQSSVSHSNGMLFNAFDIGEALVDTKSREVLQICAAFWLHARFLLYGNLVAIPRSGQTFVFCVVRTNKFSVEHPNEDSIHKAQTLDVNHVDVAFIVDYKTKLHLNSSLPLETQIPIERGLLSVEHDCRRNIKDEASHVSKLGGLSKEFSILKEIIISSLVKGTLSSLGLRTTKGVLLHGPPGTGKTSLAHSCVNDTGVNLFSVNGPEIISQFYGESEQALHEIFDSASRAAPAVVFIDELDAIAPSRKDGGEELSQRMVATLLNSMDGISRTDGVLVIAATNRPDSIDPALRRPGRLDREIEIGVPSPKQRLDILLTLLSEIDHSLVYAQIQNLALSTHGFVGADLAALCNEAALVCLRRHVKLKRSTDFSAVTLGDDVQPKEPCVGYHDCSGDIMEGSGLSNATMHLFSTEHVDSVSSPLSDLTVSAEAVQSFCSHTESQEIISTPQNAVHSRSDKLASEPGEKALLKVAFEDFEKAKMKVRPSAMREVILEIPKVSWEDVGGQKEVKKQLIEAVEWPQKHQDAFKRIGTRPPTGVLMFGPPGCSKTLMARAVASEAGLNFLAVKGPELFSKWVGESEKAVRSLFAKARANAPSIIFFDEIDGLAIIRGKENDGASVSDRVMSQLLVELDGLHQRVDVTVIAATNRPDKIDPALLRPGRFDRLLYVGPPNEADREDIFRINLRKMPCSSDVSARELAHLTKGCTGADISLICREAAIAAIEESHDASEITMAHFMVGLGRVQPSEVQSYQEFSAKFQRLVCSGATRENVECRPKLSSSSWITFWTRVKSILLMPFRLHAAFSPSKAAS